MTLASIVLALLTPLSRRAMSLNGIRGFITQSPRQGGLESPKALRSPVQLLNERVIGYLAGAFLLAVS